MTDRQPLRRRWTAACLTVCLSAALPSAAIATQAPCVTPVEAEAMALVALPEIIRQTGTVCAATLPPTSLVRRGSGPLLDKYQAAADRAWPSARATIARMGDPSLGVLLQSELARPMLTSLLVPQLVGRIAPADCPTIDRMVTLLEPLPPRNIAGIVVETLRYLKAEKARGKDVAVPDLPLCPETR